MSTVEKSYFCWGKMFSFFYQSTSRHMHALRVVWEDFSRMFWESLRVFVGRGAHGDLKDILGVSKVRGF